MVRSLDMRDRLWFAEAKRLFANGESFSLVARGSRAGRVRAYVFMHSQQRKGRTSFLRYAITLFRAGGRLHFLYMNAIGCGRAIHVANPDADTVVVTIYGARSA